MFKRLLVANRGEIALRIIKACHKLGIEAVCIYSEADTESPHLREADETVCIGPARSSDSYLNMEAIIQAAQQTSCNAIHPGYGFLAENALFAELCQGAKISFVGPPPAAIRAMGDKATARESMRSAGLPVIPGSRGTITDVEEGLRLAEEIGYPVILKATAGGGGKGMRRVDDEEQFVELFEEASIEADKAFGNAGLYLEKYIVEGRHIEFQIIADAFGNVVHLGERECSAQRRHQKLLEEAPSVVVSEELRKEIGEGVCRAMRAIGYQNAGTVEFFRDKDGNIYFMEMNTRLQVEHPVTEMITGIDLVAEQIRVAANEELSFRQEDVTWKGHAIECRINAEDPKDNFRPRPGTIELYEPPEEIEGIDIRLDTNVEAGYRIPPYYDSMIAKLIVRADDRPAAIAGMIEALKSFKITGVKTTIPAHVQILGTKRFNNGEYDTNFIERVFPHKGRNNG